MNDAYAATASAAAGWHGLLRRMLALVAVLVLAAGCATSEATLDVVSPPPGPETKYSALVIDTASGATLYQANATAARYPASLTKMMTLYLLFEAIEQGRVSKTSEIPVSSFAARQPPSKIGIRTGQTIDVESAILALAVKSGNDCAVAVAEYLGGTEEQFAQQMTARARQLGMTGTVFRNASGLPDPEQRTTARDMAILGMALKSRFPQHFHYFSERDFVFRGKTIRGHNDLIGRVDGVNGIKTGYIKASGYNIVTSVDRGSRRLMIVVMGADSARARNAHVEELIDKYMRPPAPKSMLSSLSPFD
ncbi:D-alanyl-D-alanine carboxypeptidase family protein [Mesorhizobium sp. YM1C-6-2]|jgi:D-alanyl-D-alanine carboxypeptidase|uniref:D-alanyl-D-alanine carboxypeptidase family protein n=1 Tax=Mesorhizobium sp. YM1C-6-2 TaxID=1827501 RepID=UPI000EF18EFA|nr:D-alanyl-D-alanine carboxypeptidase family protein [Mesorhizobium sp. YM1C-6-2]RLP27710.1 D-alanyl-D-alanine carboxypeptidase [Mesorhizobium sp. YM1C-6-2]